MRGSLKVAEPPMDGFQQFAFRSDYVVEHVDHGQFESTLKT